MDSSFCLFIPAYVRMQVPTVQKDQKDNNVVIKPVLFLANNVTNNFYESDLAY